MTKQEYQEIIDRLEGIELLLKSFQPMSANATDKISIYPNDLVTPIISNISYD